MILLQSICEYGYCPNEKIILPFWFFLRQRKENGSLCSETLWNVLIYVYKMHAKGRTGRLIKNNNQY